MHGHNLVIAALPNGHYGTITAATVAKDMLRTFPTIRVCLMVGIGGGVPTRHDIRLGDVVVSIPQGADGAVLQYDYGKTIQGQKFQATSHLNTPPALLLSAISGVRMTHMEEGNNISQQIASVLRNQPRWAHLKQPSSANDRLHYPHIVHAKSCRNGCGAAANLKRRNPRTELGDNPAIHYGLIASGNQLMKDAEIRDNLARERDVLCFEMEAAGLMNQLPCLVIRGICDYSDSHKNDDWHGYAAMTAAAYAKGVLQMFRPGRLRQQAPLS